MITPRYVRQMARYNIWQNRSLYGAAEQLSDAVRRQDLVLEGPELPRLDAAKHPEEITRRRFQAPHHEASSSNTSVWRGKMQPSTQHSL